MIDGAGLEAPGRLSPPAIDPSREELLSVEQISRWSGPRSFCSVDVVSRPDQGDRQCNVGFFIVDCHSVSDRVRHLVLFRPSMARGRLWNGSPVRTFGPMTLRVRTKTSFAASIKVRGSDAYPISNLEPAAAVRCPTREFPQSQRPRHRFPLSVRQHGHPGATAHSRRFRSVRDGDTLRLDPQRLALPQGSAQRTSFCFFQALLMSQKAQQSGSWTR
jgi:hypothetical protein